MAVTSLGDDFPRQQARVRECRDRGREIGPAGLFYVAVCDDLLRRADEAAISGDLLKMIAVYQEMRELKE
jgi:hypothetical protein